ncbi:unnamed protein product [Moneuplotes crassus]|uniref:Uncharacterized protein n=1 Tax=Euplotes crassus TaxID=5936 RepID=A0AAD1X8K2_EUPCR|nr:unnamed protein product [Moneuplotes crassus]
MDSIKHTNTPPGTRDALVDTDSIENRKQEFSLESSSFTTFSTVKTKVNHNESNLYQLDKNNEPSKREESSPIKCSHMTKLQNQLLEQPNLRTSETNHEESSESTFNISEAISD